MVCLLCAVGRGHYVDALRRKRPSSHATISRAATEPRGRGASGCHGGDYGGCGKPFAQATAKKLGLAYLESGGRTASAFPYKLRDMVHELLRLSRFKLTYMHAGGTRWHVDGKGAPIDSDCLLKGITEADDESYLHDQPSWPTTGKCVAAV